MDTPLSQHDKITINKFVTKTPDYYTPSYFLPYFKLKIP